MVCLGAHQPGTTALSAQERLYSYETMVGGTKDAFLNLVRFERAAVGLPPGDRHLLAERSDVLRDALTTSDLDRSQQLTSNAAIHPLAAEFELNPDQILGS